MEIFDFLILLIIMRSTSGSSDVTTGIPVPENPEAEERIHVFSVDYSLVQIPYEITLWIILASYAKIGKFL